LRRDPPDGSKVVKLGRSIRQVVFSGEHLGHLFPIGERAESIVEQFEDRQLSTREALDGLAAVLQELIEAKRAAESSGLDEKEFAVFWLLRQASVPKPEECARAVAEILKGFPNYDVNAKEKRSLKAKIYKVLLPAVGKEEMVELADRIVALNWK